MRDVGAPGLTNGAEPCDAAADVNETNDLPPSKDVLRVEGLSKAFANRWVVEDVSFSLVGRELVTILGPSGAGKTTLFKCMTGLMRPDWGTVWFDGADVHKLRARERRRIAFVFQDFNLIRRLSAFENVLGGRLGHVAGWRGIARRFERHDQLKAFECLERVGLLDQAYQRADTLSGGQQQRVAVARALAQEPHLIVADEPVASLDPASAGTVMKLLADIAHVDGVAVVSSLHQLGYARAYADRIIGMAGGAVVLDKDAASFDDQDGNALYARTFSGEAAVTLAFEDSPATSLEQSL